ncbi:enoyl-CoA hydratase-related protein [Pseudorhodoferax sp.]|uniref:enoyl-CoA hydratase-related protein n=1 Tax=Pseudorhodoferax sp. TaxID=1993553 RepID=UPI002DD62541|nr:enoyl-CoA hydratase-related protein [Pseudorhodoferax sp.]
MSQTTRHQFCSVERDGPLTIVTLERPEVMNALHSEADFELAAVWDAFAADDRQVAAIVTGAGERAFCAGNDLKLQAARGSRERPASGFGGLTTRFDLFKPVIAAVNGVAMGGGFELALSCDIIIAAENASFALPEPKVGLAALLGGAQFLPRAIGLPRAMGVLLTGRTVPAAEALQLGIVTALAPQGQALAHARAWAQQVLACSPLALQATKQMARFSAHDEAFVQTVRGARQLPAVARARAGADWTEGPRAFAEKRKPNWSV